MIKPPKRRWSVRGKAPRKTSVRGLLLATMFVLAGVTLIDAIVIQVVATRLTSSNAAVIDEIASIQAMARAKASLYEVARSTALLAETGDPLFLNFNHEARQRLFGYLAVVEGLGEESSSEVQEIRGLIDTYLEEEDALRDAELTSSEQMIEASPSFQAALDSLSHQIASSSESAVQTRHRLAELSSLMRRLWLGALGTAGLAMGLLLFTAWRQVFQSFQRMREALFAYSIGNTNVHIPEDGPVELREMAQAFNALTASLEQQRINRFEFLLAVAHDLRNPLAALKVTVALAENRAKSGVLSPEQVSLQQRRISRQVDRLNRMIEDLVDVTQVEAGRFELNFRSCDLRELVMETYDIFDEASSLHELHLELPAEPVHVRCDETRLGQVLNNLVSNAIKYSPHGGKVSVRLRRNASQAIVEVEDEGKGIEADDYRLIFEPFQRGQSGGIPGVGLGLSVAKRLVEAHLGRIEVESEVGVGSTFRLSLRLASAADPHESTNPSVAATPIQKAAART